MIIREWAAEFGVPLGAVLELERRMGLQGSAAANVQPDDEPAHSEAFAQSQIRLEAPGKDVWLSRNNVGALLDRNGTPVRYGLANESAKMNARIKSSDLIGFRKKLIQPQHVGMIIAQFVARECKYPGWVYGGDDHEKAQLKFIELVNSAGGDAAFATGPGSL